MSIDVWRVGKVVNHWMGEREPEYDTPATSEDVRTALVVYALSIIVPIVTVEVLALINT